MEDAMQRNFTKKVCDEVLGSDPCWWANYTVCAKSQMSCFYNMVGGAPKDRLNAWAVKVILEEESKMKAEKASKEAQQKLQVEAAKQMEKLVLQDPMVVDDQVMSDQ